MLKYGLWLHIFPSCWQEFSCSDEIENGRSTQLAYLLPLINLRKAWQEDLKSTHVASLSAVLQACVEEYLFIHTGLEKSLNLRTGTLSVHELGLEVATSYRMLNWVLNGNDSQRIYWIAIHSHTTNTFFSLTQQWAQQRNKLMETSTLLHVDYILKTLRFSKAFLKCNYHA